MRKNTFVMFSILVFFLIVAQPGFGKTIKFDDNWGNAGVNLISSTRQDVEIVYSLQEMSLEKMTLDGEQVYNIAIPGVWLPNDEGAPNLPGLGKYIAFPQGAKVELQIVSIRKKVYENIEIAPAPNIPLDIDDAPLIYKTDESIYNKNSFYPTQPIRISKPKKMRGVDVIVLGITPFQYNPVTKELIVYKDIRVRLNFVGGNGHFGEDRLRSKWFEPVLSNNILNYKILPSIDFIDFTRVKNPRAGECEYIIIVPDDADFIAWADTIKHWRKLQGILTDVYKISDPEIGSNTVAAIEGFVNTAYNTWSIPPVAVILLSDYQSSGKAYGITSPSYAHPYSGTYVTDNTYADVDGDKLPDMNFARITAQDNADLTEMINKFLDYERDPPIDAGYYDHPLVACGWQTTRWFQLCTEIVRGFWDNELGKNPVKQYKVYNGTPSVGCDWSSATNTATVVNYFGPSGLGYILSTNPYTFAEWDFGSAGGINSDINTGCFIVQHRDHGGELGWGEPSYNIGDLSGLSNTMLPFVFSINCLTGRYDWSSECFTEAFHRMQHGALGLIAASQVSYSFVNDTYIFGLYDGMWPNFDPGNEFSSQQDTFLVNLRPGFASVSGKYYLEASGWPYNPGDKNITYDLFHTHCDAFITLFSQIPDSFDITHNDTVPLGPGSFTVTVKENDGVTPVDNALVCCWCKNDVAMWVRGHTNSSGQVTLNINPSITPDTMWVTVTKYNHFRYQGYSLVLEVGAPEIPIVYRLFNYEKYPSQNPTFEFKSKDPQDDEVLFCLYWDTDPDFASPDSDITGTFPSDTRVSHTLSATLSQNVTYWCKVRSKDPAGSGYYSGWATPISFTIDTLLTNSHWFQTTAAQFNACLFNGVIIEGDSLVIALNNSVTLLQQGFENATFPPTDWAKFAGPSNGSSNDWARLTDEWNSGSASAGIKYDGASTVDRFLATRQLDLTGVANTHLVFWSRDNWASYYVYHGIWASTGSQANAGDYVEVTSINVTAEDTWQERTVDLSAYDGSNSVYFAFRYNEQNGTDWWIDDVLITGDSKGDSGVAKSPPVVYVDFPDRDGWDKAKWTQATGNDSIRLQIEYLSGGSWTLIPDGSLPNNSAGFFTAIQTGEVDISGLDTMVYDTLRLRTTFIKKSGKAAIDPSLLDWEVGTFPKATSITLTVFEATSGKAGVRIHWRTESEVDNAYWVIERGIDLEGEWGIVGTTPGQGTKPTPTDYEYMDETIDKDGEYYYRLVSIDGGGNKETYGPIKVKVSGFVPRVYSLHKVYPNPFSRRLVIRYDVPKSSNVSLRVYNVSGRVVRTLINGKKVADYYSVMWDAKGDGGRRVGYGVYFLRMDAANYTRTQKVLYVR